MKAKIAKSPYFDSKAGNYWLEVKPGKFLQLDTSQTRLHLRQSGLSDKEWIGDLNQLEAALFNAQVERAVDYAGALAGYPCGEFINTDGKRVLVTRGMQFIEAKRGKCSGLSRFFDELLGSQSDCFFAWLKCARESLVKRDFAPGQLIVLAGESGCGKSLCQSVITSLLGGRAAKAFRYMSGATTFNAELAECEHWVIEDDNSSVDIRARRTFGCAIKDLTVNTIMSVHGKGIKAIMLSPYKRGSLSCNIEPENLMILPPLDASIMDKLMLFKCGFAEVGNDRVKTWASFQSEFAAFAQFLSEFKIPKALKCPRYGVQAWHHPDILEIVNASSPEHRLLLLIDEILWQARSPKIWQGTSEQLETELRGGKFTFAVDKLLYFSSACGVYLARLATKHPERVQKLSERWQIKGPVS